MHYIQVRDWHALRTSSPTYTVAPLLLQNAEFLHPVDAEQVPQYKEFVVFPCDISTIEKVCHRVCGLCLSLLRGTNLLLCCALGATCACGNSETIFDWIIEAAYFVLRLCHGASGRDVAAYSLFHVRLLNDDAICLSRTSIKSCTLAPKHSWPTLNGYSITAPYSMDVSLRLHSVAVVLCALFCSSLTAHFVLALPTRNYLSIIIAQHSLTTNARSLVRQCKREVCKLRNLWVCVCMCLLIVQGPGKKLCARVDCFCARTLECILLGKQFYLSISTLDMLQIVSHL